MSRTIRLPVPPSVNAYWKIWRTRLVKTPEAKRYVHTVKMLALAAGMRPSAAPVAVTVIVHRKARRGDLDGFLKLLLDSLQGVAFVNDAQVVELHAIRRDRPMDPHVLVTVEDACAEQHADVSAVAV